MYPNIRLEISLINSNCFKVISIRVTASMASSLSFTHSSSVMTVNSSCETNSVQ